MKCIYISGPLTAVTEIDRMQNILNAAKVARQLRRWGAVCIIPHLESYLMGDLFDHAEWLQHDYGLISRCDAMAVLPKWRESPGSRSEVEFCIYESIPYFELITDSDMTIQRVLWEITPPSLEDLIAWLRS